MFFAIGDAWSAGDNISSLQNLRELKAGYDLKIAHWDDRKVDPIAGPLYVQFVMGAKNAMPADWDAFDYFIRTVNRLAPDAEWCAAGIGPHQIEVNEWCVAAGGHTRTGLEDNLRLDRHTLAPSNAALVRRVVDLCDRCQRPVATVA